MLRVFTGENRLLSDALVRDVRMAMLEDKRELFIVVPKQLTLMTERLLLDGLGLTGSFRLRVLSPARLCELIFELAGSPDGTRVDERGRVMLMRRAIRAADGLTIYRNADRQIGFSERCARQLEIFIQGGVTPAALRDCASDSQGATRMKLNDLAAIMEQYEALIRGRFQDGDTELIEAQQRVADAGFLCEGHFWFFGFDIVPPTLTRLIARIASLCQNSALFLSLPNDPSARDYDCAIPVERAYARLCAACEEEGAAVERVRLDDQPGTGCLEALRRELFAFPCKPWKEDVSGIRLVLARDVREECLLAAAEARRLAMINGLHYGDIQLLCTDPDTYRQPLAEAFARYQVPLFQEGGRPVSRLSTAECLLTALRLLEKNFRNEDVFTLMRCGYMDITQDEADRLANYALHYGIEGGRWLKHFRRGRDEEIAEMEPMRARLMAPVRKLRDALRVAKDLKAQLRAVFGFLENVNAHGRSEQLQREFIAYGMREEAGALSQSWNRIVGALDQMAALMGSERLSLRELYQTLSESLEAAVVKPLPQSGDAVYAQRAGRMLMQPARALLIIGLNDAGVSDEDGLLTEAQRRAVAQRAKAYLGPDDVDVERLRRFYLKSALGMASDEVWFSCAMSASDGSAQREGLTLQLVRSIFPGLHELTSEERAWLLSCAPAAALSRAAHALCDSKVGEQPDPDDLGALSALQAASAKLPREGDRLIRMEKLLEGRGVSESVDPSNARAVYGALQYQSITSLERFARCPFAYFARYGLHVRPVEPFEFNRRDVGEFLHEAVKTFLSANREELNELPGDEAERRMKVIVDEMLARATVDSPMEDSASVRAESRALSSTACRCARVLAKHMRGSKFRAAELERGFGRDDGEHSLRVLDIVLEGRIDRMDLWEEGNGLRVIDYKLGGKPLNLAGTYHGLELQLPVYLGAAMRVYGARSAGVYYFPLDEGVVDTQETDPQLVERERVKRFRMTGLLPSDEKLLRAQTPDISAVFNVPTTKDGKLYSSVARADDYTFDRLVNHALAQVESHIRRIRAGEADVSPASFDKRQPCTYCDYRAACLFDANLDARKVRRFRNIKAEVVLKMLAIEDEK